MAPPPITLRAGTPADLARYLARQLDHLFPDAGCDADQERALPLVAGALERMRPLLEAVRNFEASRFDHFHALQYASFLYLVSNEASRQGQTALADRVFCLNRALNAIDLYHAVVLPEVFFLSHALGAVLGNAQYGNRLVVFQQVTVGRVGEQRPRLGANVVLYPGAVVTGASVLGDGCVVAAGTVVHGVEAPPDSLVCTRGGNVVVEPRRRDYASHYFRPA